jgi:hypothetical protein
MNIEMNNKTGMPTAILISETPNEISVDDIVIEQGNCLLNSFKVARKYPNVEVVEGVAIYVDSNDGGKPMIHAWNRLGDVHFDVTKDKIWVNLEDHKDAKEVRYASVLSFFASEFKGATSLEFREETKELVKEMKEHLSKKE